MLKKILITLFGVALSAAILQAQQTSTRVAGTITAIEGDHIQIKDPAGKTTIVMLQKNTRYRKSEKAATKADLKVGTRVAIESKMDDKMKMYAAEEVTIDPADARPTPSGTDGTKTR